MSKSSSAPDLVVVRGPLGRESLHLEVVTLDRQSERLAWLLEYLRQADGSGIVYVLTVADARRVSEWLGAHGVDAPAYYGAVPDETRRQLEQRLRDNDVKALVATVALGMGFDKPDLTFVVHFQRPSSVISYYQQIGRAGRGVERAQVVLLAGAEDDAIAEYFIGEAFPPEETMAEILAVAEQADGVSSRDLEGAVNAKKKTIENALRILEVEGAVVHDDALWTRTPNEWSPDSERIEAVTRTRLLELERMREFVATEGCLMQFLIAELDGPPQGPCGRCANCVGSFVAAAAEPALVNEATLFLKRAHRPIEPRKRWPPGLGDERRGNIAVELRLQEGRALSVYGDAGWGSLVREGKYDASEFDDELVEAVAEMIETDLAPAPAPTWVTGVPSLRSSDLVPGFARRLADRLGLPYRSSLVKVRQTPPQKAMENSVQQARNVIGAFAVEAGEVESGPVLLVDDMVDSRWTFTICGAALLEAGSGPVYPVALAETTSGAGG